jgi:transposase-like protein
MGAAGRMCTVPKPYPKEFEDGVKPGTTTAENAENRELKKRIRLLEQENEVLRRAAAYLSQANLPGK